jgi:hypothetical protein
MIRILTCDELLLQIEVLHLAEMDFLLDRLPQAAVPRHDCATAKQLIKKAASESSLRPFCLSVPAS